MKKLRIALAGNANVGKSVVFNQLTGLAQHIGNWPGKTVEKAEGSLAYRGYRVEVVDLPGVYSISANSPEEKVAEEYIRRGRPDVVVNIVDASVLERNLYLTLQLLELGAPLVLVLNMEDVAERRGIRVDAKALGRELGVPVVEAVAVHGKGIEEIIRKAIAAKEGRIKAGKRMGRMESPSGRYKKVERIVERVERKGKVKMPLEEKIDSIALHHVYGYALLALVVLGVFFSIFTFGEWLSGILYGFFGWVDWQVGAYLGSWATESVLWKGVAGGIFAGIAVAMPFILPFYIIFAMLEDSGYIARMAFLMDGFMRQIGLHGKAFIPLFLGYGCSVPACIGCRIIETGRERFQAAVLATMVPCAARSVIILGLVGAYMGWWWALAIYLFNILVVGVLGKAMGRVLPGEPTALVMEMPSYKMPQLRTILRRSLERVKQYALMAFPIIVAVSVLISLVEWAGLLGPAEELLSPVTVGMLGLPAAVGIALVFGVLRKELALIMLAGLFGTVDFGAVFSPVQMVVFTLVMVFYIPCSATIAALVKEFGWRKAAAVTAFEIAFAVALGGIAYLILPAVLA